MKKYFLSAILVTAGLITVTIMCLAAGWLPEIEILSIVGIVFYIITLRGWLIDPEEIENFWEEKRSGK